VIMEVCGTHTMAIARHGIRSFLPAGVKLISGPGCPVCVTEPGYIDAAIELARRGALLATFGDLVAVPGSRSSLSRERARGARVKVCYSPIEALRIAAENAGSEVVFLAVGFETTAAPVMAALEMALRNGIENLSFLTAFKRIIPAMKALISDVSNRIDAFLCPGHVSAIIGASPYREIVSAGIPCAITGFEPADILYALRRLIEMLREGRADVENLYSRVVRESGNTKAQQIMSRFLVVTNARWRGLGEIRESGLRLRETWSRFDAEIKHGVTITEGTHAADCLCGEVVKGKLEPEKCAHFGRDCIPELPLGPCMVSSEGTCAAHYRYLAADSVRHQTTGR